MKNILENRCIIFSDIHGHFEALQKMMEIESSGTFIFCGDICGYYYQADECVQLLRKMGNNLIAVRGNHDQYYIDSFHDANATKYLVNQYGSSYQDKIENVRDFISDLPLQITLELHGKEVHVQHGAPNDYLEGRLYPDTILPDLEGIYIIGHTHYQMLRTESRSLWINPGSLGQPRDGKGFSYCTFSTNSMTFSFQSVKVDITNLISEIRTRDPANKYLEEILYRRS